MKKSYKSKRLVEVFRQKTPPFNYYFRVRRRENGEVIASSEGYSRKIDCINTAKLVTGGRLKVTVLK